MAAEHRCDGHRHCQDGADEDACGPVHNSTLYLCTDGSSRLQAVVCDGILDCARPDDDEGDCKQCRRGAILCDKRCVPAAQRCVQTAASWVQFPMATPFSFVLP